MKRYLIKSAMALSLGAFMIGCADHDVDDTSTAEAKIQSFDENFRSTYGTIASGHDWGFGSSEAARTRYAQTDGNMWGPSTDPSRYTQPYVVPAPLTQAQKDKVRDWFQTHPNPSGLSLTWTDFFVQQVYKGGDSPTTDCPEVYTAKDGETSVKGSDKMDYLTAGSDNDHINNFNWGTYSNDSETSIQVWNGTLDSSKGNDFNDQKVYYFDQITLMRESSTSCFGYNESFISKHYNDHFVIIAGSTIDNDIDDGPSLTGMYFVGFDFEADDTDKALSQQVDRDYYFSDWIVRITEGVLPDNGGGDTSGGNSSSSTTTYNYSETVEDRVQTSVTQGRIFCEDLGATTDSTNKRRDIDYNDVVFDAYLIREVHYTRYIKRKTTYVDGVYQREEDNGSYEQTTSTNNYTKIRLLAAGGTIPLTVAGQEVHAKFGVDLDEMVNTVNDGQQINGRSISGKTPVEFTTQYYSELRDIPVIARWGTTVIELTAHEGQSPQKICVPIGTAWSKERACIDYSYPDFKDWVNRNVSTPWYNYRSEHLYNRAPITNYYTMDEYSDVLESSSYSSSQETSTSYSVSPSANEQSIWSDLSGNKVFPSDWSNSLTLEYNQVGVNDKNGKAFGVGSKIRVYLHTQNYWSLQLNWRDTDNNWNWEYLMYSDASHTDINHFSGSDGYVEYTVTEESLAQIQKAGIVVQGGNMTLLMLTVDNTNATAASTPSQPAEPTFTTPSLSGESSVYSSSDGVALSSSGQSVTDGLSSVGENTEFTVHGISDGGSVSVTTSDGTALQSVSSARTRAGRTRTASQVSLKFKVQSADVASKVRSGGIKVVLNSGSFKLYMVSAKIVTYTPSTPPSSGDAVEYVLWQWEETDWDKSGYVRVWANDYKTFGDWTMTAQYADAAAGSRIKIYGKPAEADWYIIPNNQYTSGGVSFVGHPADTKINASNVSNYGSDTCITLVFDETTGAKLSSNGGFSTNVSNFYLSKVTFEKISK